MYILGHFTTKLFELNPPLKACYKITGLREPVDRAISAAFFHGHNASKMDHDCLGIDISLRRKRCKKWWHYSNDMVRYYSGHGIHWNTYDENELSANVPNRSHLERAKDKLSSSFDLVCFLHDLPSCAKEVMEAFHLNITHIPSLAMMKTDKDSNIFKTPTRTLLSEKLMAKFKDSNNLDLELYDWALARAKRK